MAKQRNEQQRRERFDKYFSKFDEDSSGYLNLGEFIDFLEDYNKRELPDEQNEFLFHGIDIDNSGKINKEELWQLVEALNSNNSLYINILFFRAVDKNKSREIDASEFVKLAKINGYEITEEEAQNQIRKLTSRSNKLTFAQFYKVITGEDIPKDTDPYDGKIPLNIKQRSANSNANVNSNADVNKNTRYITEAEKNQIKELFAKYDKSNNGKLEFDEFLKFMMEGLEIGDVNSPTVITQMRFLYDGMDIDASHNLDEDEVIRCLESFKTNDLKFLTKMIFRGADKDKSGKVSIEELKYAVDNLGEDGFNQDDFYNKCRLEFGKRKKELEYWEFYKIISGETLTKSSPDYDPYEGRFPEKSKCCLLL